MSLNLILLKCEAQIAQFGTGIAWPDHLIAFTVDLNDICT